MALERRRFVWTGLAALSLAGGRAIARGSASGDAPTPPDGGVDARKAPPESRPGEGPSGSAAPIEAGRFAMVVDVKACLREKGCRDCIDACHRAHNVPDLPGSEEEVKWVWREPFGEALPDLRHEHLPPPLADGGVLVLCNHCDVPPCTRVCPTQATWKREDGVVMMDWHRCIGCRYCVAACPYGSRSFNWRDPRPFLARTEPGFPTRTRGVVEKCNFCEERLGQGRPPACVEACKAKALIFGDLEDPGSPVRQELGSRLAVRRRPTLGTDPRVYYLL